MLLVQAKQPLPALLPDPSTIILGQDTDTHQPISASQVDLCSGTYIVGVQGMGKSSLLEQIVYQQMQRDEAIIVIDPHGDLVDSIMAHMPESKLAKTFLLDLKDRAYPFGLSAFSCSNPYDEEERDTTRIQIMHAFEKLWPETKAGQYFRKILRHVVITLIENPQLTLADVRRLLLDEEYRQQYTSYLANSETRSFWQDEYDQLSVNKRNSETNPLRGRLDELLTEPVIKNILKQTYKTVNIRKLIEEQAILLVKLPVNEEAYKYSAPVVGTLLMAMIYAAIFSFADTPQARRPGCTLVVDEFQNFATDEYAKLFEQGRKYNVKQFLAHQHRQQFMRGDTGSTNEAATLSANTIVAFRTIPKDSTEIASLFSSLNARHRPTNFYLYPTEKLAKHPNSTVKKITRAIVDKLDEASGGKLTTRKEYHRNAYSGVESVRTIRDSPQVDFGAGYVPAYPPKAEAALQLLDECIYDSEEQNQIVKQKRDAFLREVAPFWKFQNYLKGNYDNQDERKRYSDFTRELDTLLELLIKEPIAEDATLSSSDIGKLLQDQRKRHAFIKSGSQAFQIETRDTRLLQTPVTQGEAVQRYSQVQAQTRVTFCVPRFVLEAEEQETEEQQPEEQQPFEEPQQEPVLMETYEHEPPVVPEPETILPDSTILPEPEKPRTEPIPESLDALNTLYAQLKAKAIDPDTTILATLGEHYVLTIKQWMRLYAWKSYPRATQYFKELREQGFIFRKDREGRGGNYVSGDWFFLLTKGANELVKRKQATPLFKLEPNEAEKTSGDTLFHTYLVNELLIHLRLLERTQPETMRIEQLDHERSMRRDYLSALADFKLYPDGFLRLLAPTQNGLKRRYTFLELEHTTQ